MSVATKSCPECQCSLRVEERAEDVLVTITAGGGARDAGRDRFRWSVPLKSLVGDEEVELAEQSLVRVGRECGCGVTDSRTGGYTPCTHAPYLVYGKPAWR